MQIGGIAWWVLLGMFGFGAAVALVVGFFLTRRLAKPVPGDFWGGCWNVIYALVLVAIAMPVTGIVAVALTFWMHHAGWDRPLPFLAGIGIVFLALLAGWIIRLYFKR